MYPADEHPQSQVIGVDLSPIQPSLYVYVYRMQRGYFADSPSVPPNVSFYVDDLEDDWAFATKFDFIFSRFITGAIRDFPRYFRQCYEYHFPSPFWFARKAQVVN